MDFHLRSCGWASVQSFTAVSLESLYVVSAENPDKYALIQVFCSPLRFVTPFCYVVEMKCVSHCTNSLPSMHTTCHVKCTERHCRHDLMYHPLQKLSRHTEKCKVDPLVALNRKVAAFEDVFGKVYKCFRSFHCATGQDAEPERIIGHPHLAAGTPKSFGRKLASRSCRVRSFGRRHDC